MKKKNVYAFLIGVILIWACSDPIKVSEKGIAVFNIKVGSAHKSINLNKTFADTLTAVTIRIFKDSVFVILKEAKLISGLFTVEIALEDGKNYFAKAEAFISNLRPPAFIGNSSLFEIKAGQTTVVDILLITTATAVQIISPADSVKNNEKLSLKLNAFFPNNASRDVTRSASWKINPGVAASIDNSGTVMPFPNSVGTEVVKAEYRGLSDSLMIRIVKP